MTGMRDLITQEGAAVARAKRRDALCFIRFVIEQMSVLNTCVKMLREGDEQVRALLLLALLDILQSKPMKVNMKEPVELEPTRNESNDRNATPNCNRSSAIRDPSETLGDPVMEQTMRKLIETSGRLVAKRNAAVSGVTANYGTVDDTGRVQPALQRRNDQKGS